MGLVKDSPHPPPWSCPTQTQMDFGGFSKLKATLEIALKKKKLDLICKKYKENS